LVRGASVEQAEGISMAKSLTTKRIAKLTEGRYRDPGSKGLYLQVGPRGTKSWLLRYEIAGRERFHGLGAYPDFSLAMAHERAAAARRLIADGIDPIDHRRAEKHARQEQLRKEAAIPTFKEAAERYFRVHGDKWRNAKHRAQFMSTLRAYAFPKLGALRVNEITTDDVRAAIEPIWKKVPETASRVRGRIESVLSWAIANKYREGPNPARWSDNLVHLLPARASNGTNHHAALVYGDMPEFMAALGQREGVAARALEFAILTAARTGEIIGAKWDEIDLKAKTWTVPADRMKASAQHRVPISDRAVEILEALPRERGNDYVFIGPSKGGGLSNMAMAAVLKRMGRTDITVHGFRSSFRTWAAETTSYPHDVAEAALAHTIPEAVVRAYKRTTLFDKRRRMMTDWARYCASPAPVGEVVPLRRAKG
jgi:integrase